MLINGEPMEPFRGNGGLRQGNPISPLLFILVMEYITRMLSAMEKEPGFQFHPLCKQFGLTNLAFVDDLLILCSADQVSIQKLTMMLRTFAELSGLQANLQKSQIYLGGVSPHTKQHLLRISKFQAGSFPMRHLGFPIASRRWTKQECFSLVEKVAGRLKCWSTRHLSFAGRLLLINSALHSFKFYWISAFLIPKGILREIDKLCRHFLWAGN